MDRRVKVDHYARLEHWRTLLQTLVRPVFVEVAHVLGQHPVGMAFVVDQQMIGAFLPDAAHEPFCVAVGSSRRPHLIGLLSNTLFG